MIRKTLALFLSILIVLLPAVGAAGPPRIPGFYGAVTLPTVAPTALPVAKPGGVLQGVRNMVSDPSKNQLLINQSQSRAIIDWQSFNIGANAWVRFDQQKNKDWVALNRIFDANPAQIFGKLTADGKVSLINRNGILFGPGSQVNVHSLVASSLRLDADDAIFLDASKGVNLRFRDDGSGGGAPGAVSNHGAIGTDQLGSVFLIGPLVENGGTIVTPEGQAGLAAGADVSLRPDSGFNSTRAALVVTVNQDPGVAQNLEGGQIVTDSGLAGMYGREVRQDGLIRAVTAIRRNGQIELQATDRIATGAASVTETPVTDSPEKFHESFVFTGGDIRLGGLAAGVPVKAIEHHGAITAPGGTVILDASDRVFLETGSRVDVSGLWSEKAAKDATVSTQLGSVALRDAYGQKGGVLQGATVQVDPLTGSAIGDVSGALASQELSARERSMSGGTITVNALGGDIIVKQGAGIDFAGGGARYDQGNMETTKLLSGNRVYDIGGAPGALSYNKLLGDQETRHRRFGVTEKFQGVYYGGGAPMKDFARRFVEGADAGSVALLARRVVLDGALNGRAERGIYQTLAADPVDGLGRKKARGLTEPSGGALIIGATKDSDDPAGNDQVVNEIAVAADVAPLPAGFGADSPGDLQLTTLSSKTLNEAGLGRLELHANSRVAIEEGAAVSLRPGGAFTATARRIEHRGKISAPAGSVTLTTRDNITTPAGDGLVSRIVLAEGSRIDAAGEKVDNTGTEKGNGGPVLFGHVAGGTVDIKDKTDLGEGVVVGRGAHVDVSGGYSIDAKGNVSAGNAGSLLLQGATLIVDGEVKGRSLPGASGGKLLLHAAEVAVTPSAPDLPPDFRADSVLPGDRRGKLLLAGDRIVDTGFTRVEIKSRGDVTVAEGAFLSPSAAKMAVPVPGRPEGAAAGPGNVFDMVGAAASAFAASPDYLGPSSVTVAANSNFEGTRLEAVGNLVRGPHPGARIDVKGGGGIRAGIGGAIGLNAPGITVSGLLDAPAGKIEVRATGQDLTVTSGAAITAEGVNKPQAATVAKGLAVGPSPLPGGTVALSAAEGDLAIGKDALVSVRGAPPVTNRIRSDGDTLSSVTVAGDAGSVSLAYGGTLTVEGDLRGNPMEAGLKGGSLRIHRENEAEGLVASAGDIRRFQESGFDALTLGSAKSLSFSGSFEAAIGRSLTLDAPQVLGLEADSVVLRAPWIRLTNSSATVDAPVAPGQARLALRGDWVDVEGSVSLSGFGGASLEASHDIRFSDRQYGDGSGSFYRGSLATAADLTLASARTYPTTRSNFTIRTEGKVTTLPGGEPDGSPVYSAGGGLAIDAKAGIEHRGVLAAPFGSISFNKDPEYRESRVYLAEGSLLTTSGGGSVKYGFLDADQSYRAPDKGPAPDPDGIKVAGAPQKTVDLNGSEVIVKSGARIDVSGGGSVFAYQFQPGIEGSVNPLTVEGRYVIVPDGSVNSFEDAVYLSGGYGIPAGTYSLLPAEYAFLLGAMVITDLGTDVIPGTRSATSEGFPIVGGYKTVMGTDIRSPILKGFSIRSAADVLKEGNFTVKTLQAGDAGAVSLRADTTILNGTVDAAALAGYRGGTLAMSGKNVTVQPTGVSLPSNFVFDTPVEDQFRGTLVVDSSALSGKGLQEIRLGTIDSATPRNSTATVVLKPGTSLDAPVVTLSATDAITLESGSQVNAVDAAGGGVATLTTQGKLTIGSGAQAHASDKVALDVREIDFRGANPIRVDHSAIDLKGDRIFFVPDGFAEDHPDQAAANPGLYVTDSIWNGLSGFDAITLKSRSDLLFGGDFDLRVGQTLTVDAGRIGAAAPGDGGAVTVSLAAPKIELRNTGAAPSGGPAAGAGTMNVSATDLSVGRGDIVFDGLSSLHLDSAGDLTVKGAGSLATGGDLAVTAARVTASNYVESNSPYQVADFVLAAAGAVAIGKSAGAPGQTSVPGGSLEIRGKRIDQGGVIAVDAGTVTLTATGIDPGDGITLRSGSSIAARGTDPPQGSGGSIAGEPAGKVVLRTAGSPIAVEQGATIDVASGAAGDAGNVTLAATGGDVTLQGNLQGNLQGASATGRGGSFTLDAGRVADFSALNNALSAGGFTGSIDVRARGGDITVGAGDTVRGRAVRLAADGGGIDLHGSIDASGSEGGIVELFAGNDLALRSGSRIAANAAAAGGAGGEVLLSSANGLLDMASGSAVDVSGGAGGSGGTVSFRAPRTAADVSMNLNGTVTGASEVVAEGFKTYQAGTIGVAEQSAWLGEAGAYMANAGAIRSRLLSGLTPGSANFRFLPGIEARSAGNLTVTDAWDLTSARFGSEPGALTLRAGGDLLVADRLVDHPTPLADLNQGGGGRDSWAFTLAAGSDLGGANPFATVPGTGTLRMSSPASLVYTESAPIRFASGGNTEIGSGTNPGYMTSSNARFRYTLGSYDGNVKGDVGGDLKVAGGTIQTDTGDIDIAVGRDLDLIPGGALGSIRTMGEHRPVPGKAYFTYGTNYWEYEGGGDISLDVGGAVRGGLADGAWDVVKKDPFRKRFDWSASYDPPTGGKTTDSFRGIGALGGGNVAVRTGGDYYCQTGTFGKGDLVIRSGGNLKGRFLVRDGRADLRTMGDFGTFLATADDGRVIRSAEDQVIEAFDARIDVAAQGGIALGTVLNPTIARDEIAGAYWNLQYGRDSNVTLTARTGDIALSGKTSFYSSAKASEGTAQVLPPGLEIRAGGDIRLAAGFALAPSAEGRLLLEAGGDIDGFYTARSTSTTVSRKAKIAMSDADPDKFYGFLGQITTATDPTPALFDPQVHGPVLSAEREAGAVTVRAGGDIRNFDLFVPKPATISAGRDIRDLFFVGQNLAPEDVTAIRADRDILFVSDSTAGKNATGIQVGGPGALVVQAGGSIDLGTTRGIQTYGNTYNIGLGTKGSSVYVAAGLDGTRNVATNISLVEAFFDAVRAEGVKYSLLKKEGDAAGALQTIQEARDTIIDPFFGGPLTGAGADINMVSSQISTNSGKDDIFVIATGTVNVGKSTIVLDRTQAESQLKNTGIYTAGGGAIDIFTGGDINVNEARVMTFQGGDITAWSDRRNINAGRGSKTAISSDPPKLVKLDPNDPNSSSILVFSPPAVGSGIRTLTFAAGFDEAAPPAGDVFLFAPTGAIDAGEAGILGRNVTLGATQVLNAGNISFSAGSVGVPAADSAVSIGALAGTGALAETSKMIEQSASLGSTGGRTAMAAAAIGEDIVTRWLDVKVISFDAGSEEDPEDKDKDKK